MISYVVFAPLTTVFKSILTSEIEVFFKANMMISVTITEVSIVVKLFTFPSGSNILKILETPTPATTAIAVLAI